MFYPGLGPTDCIMSPPSHTQPSLQLRPSTEEVLPISITEDEDPHHHHPTASNFSLSSCTSMDYLRAFRVADLRLLLAARGLSKDGRKEDLVKRMWEWAEAEVAMAEEEQAEQAKTLDIKPAPSDPALNRLEERERRFGPVDPMTWRARRFGLNQDERLESRKKRFSSADINPDSLEVMKRRAERFGETVSKKLRRLESQEAKEKRVQRFGGGAN